MNLTQIEDREEKIAQLGNLLADGYRPHQAAAFAAEHWGILKITANKLIAEARRKACVVAKQPKQERLAKSIAFLSRVIDDPKENRLIKLKFLQELHALRGDYAPKKLAVSSASDEPPLEIVVRYANEAQT